MPGCARPVGYVPRQTHECDAAVLVRRHLAELRVGPLPAFVKAELEGFAGCGDFELGFVRTCCRSGGDEQPGLEAKRIRGSASRTSRSRSLRVSAAAR